MRGLTLGSQRKIVLESEGRSTPGAKPHSNSTARFDMRINIEIDTASPAEWWQTDVSNEGHPPLCLPPRLITLQIRTLGSKGCYPDWCFAPVFVADSAGGCPIRKLAPSGRDRGCPRRLPQRLLADPNRVRGGRAAYSALHQVSSIKRLLNIFYLRSTA